MKLLYASDLHGSESHYARLIALSGRLKPDLVILGGDLLPDDSALDPARMGQGQPQFVRGRFREFMAALRDASHGQPVALIFGNHDWGSSVAAMEELAAEGRVTMLDLAKPLTLKGLNFVGYSFTPPTPFYVKDFERMDMPGDGLPLLGGAKWDARFSRPSTQSAAAIFKGRQTIADELAAAKPPAKPWIFVAHAPPHDSKLDMMYSTQLAGSRAIRAFIEKYQPMLSLHGHIHESPRVSGEFQSRIGSTVCANPGQSAAFLDYLEIDVDPVAGLVRSLEHGQQR